MILPAGSGSLAAFILALLLRSTTLPWELLTIALITGALQQAGVSVGGYAAISALLILSAAIRAATARKVPTASRTQFFAMLAVMYLLVIASNNTDIMKFLLGIGFIIADSYYQLVTQLLGEIAGDILGAVAGLIAYLLVFRVLMNFVERVEGLFAHLAALGATMLSASVLFGTLKSFINLENPGPGDLAIIFTIGVAAAMDIFEAISRPTKNIDKLAAVAPLTPFAAVLVGAQVLVALLSVVAIINMTTATATASKKGLIASMLLAIAASFASLAGGGGG